MAVIARIKETGLHVVVVGTGYGAFESARASRLLGDIHPKYQEGRFPMVAVVAKDGEIAWCPSEALEIVEIDGKSPAEYLAGPGGAESVAAIPLPAGTSREVVEHPQYVQFLEEDRERAYLPDERLVLEFQEWREKQGGR